MKGWKKLFGFAIVLALTVCLVADPAAAQCDKSSGGSCGSKTVAQERSCGGSCGSSCTDKAVAQETSCGSSCGSSCSQDLVADGGGAPDMGGMENCEICKHVFSDTDLIMACEYSVSDLKDGVVFSIHLKDPALIDRFRAFQKRDKALCEKFKNCCPSTYEDNLCQGCAEYLTFVHDGLTEEEVNTPNGAITIARTSDPKLLKRVHTWSNQVRQMLASFDMNALAAAAPVDADCCGTCGGTCTDIAVAAAPAGADSSCCGTCGGSAKAEACPVTGATSGTCTATAAKTCPLPQEMQDAMAECELCRVYLENHELAMASKPSVFELKNGMVVLGTVSDPRKVKAYQDFHARFMKKVEKLMKQSWDEASRNLCPMCRQWGELEHAGADIESKNTPTGIMTVVTASNDSVVDHIHALAEQYKLLEKLAENL